MADKIKKVLLLSLITLFGLTIFGCKSPPPAPVEPEEIPEIEEKYDITGTWFSGDHRARIVYQYRPDGAGCEITINQGSTFSLTYRPFNYSLTDNSITITFSDSMRPANIVYNYEMTSAVRLKKADYTPGFSPTFVKQEVTIVEGLWRREGTDNVEYLFGGRNFLLKMQNGVPTATGNFILSASSLIINDLHRCTDYYMLRWVTSTASHDNYMYRLDGDRLSLSSGGRENLFIKSTFK